MASRRPWALTAFSAPCMTRCARQGWSSPVRRSKTHRKRHFGLFGLFGRTKWIASALRLFIGKEVADKKARARKQGAKHGHRIGERRTVPKTVEPLMKLRHHYRRVAADALQFDLIARVCDAVHGDGAVWRRRHGIDDRRGDQTGEEHDGARQVKPLLQGRALCC